MEAGGRPSGLDRRNGWPFVCPLHGAQWAPPWWRCVAASPHQESPSNYLSPLGHFLLARPLRWPADTKHRPPLTFSSFPSSGPLAEKWAPPSRVDEWARTGPKVSEWKCLVQNSGRNRLARPSQASPQDRPETGLGKLLSSTWRPNYAPLLLSISQCEKCLQIGPHSPTLSSGPAHCPRGTISPRPRASLRARASGRGSGSESRIWAPKVARWGHLAGG